MKRSLITPLVLLAGLLPLAAASQEPPAPPSPSGAALPEAAPQEPARVLIQDPGLERLECTLLFHHAEAEAVAAALLVELEILSPEGSGRLERRPGHLRAQLELELLSAEEQIAARVAAWADPAVELAALEQARARLARRWAGERLLPGTLSADELERRTHGARAGSDSDSRLAELDALDPERFAAERAAILSRARLWVGAAGPEPVARVAARLDAALAALPAGEPAPPDEPPPFLEPPHTRVHLVDLPAADATELLIAAPGSRRLAPDEAALAVFTQSLQSGPRAEALDELLSELGLELTTPPGFQPRWERSGRFELGVRCAHEDAPAAAAAVVRWLRDASRPLDEAELNALRLEILASPEHRSHEVRAKLARALELRLHGYPENYWAERARQLRALDPAAVSASVARYLDPDRLVIVAVGPAASLEASLERIGPVELEPDGPRPLVERMFDALGGRERWRSTRYLESEIDFQPGGSELVVPLHSWRDLEQARLRVDQGGGVVLVLDGEEAWRRMGTNVQPLPEAVHAALLRAAWYDPHALLRQLAVSGPELWRETGWRRFELVEGPAAGVWMELDADGRPARLGALEAEGEALHALEDWIDLGGLPTPARVVRGGPRGWIRSYRKLVVLPELDEDLFRR